MTSDNLGETSHHIPLPVPFIKPRGRNQTSYLETYHPGVAPRDGPPARPARGVSMGVSPSEVVRKTTCCDGVRDESRQLSRNMYICDSPRVSRTTSLRIVESRLLTKTVWDQIFKHGWQDDRPAAVSRYMQQRVGHAIHTLSAYATHGPFSTGLLAAAAPDGSCSLARCRNRQWSSGRQAACRRR